MNEVWCKLEAEGGGQRMKVTRYGTFAQPMVGMVPRYRIQEKESQPDICKQTTNWISGKHSRGISSRAQRPGYLCGGPGQISDTKDSQISDTKTRPDIRQLHAGRYPSAVHSRISVSCTQPDIRQLRTAGYLGTGWGQISGLASGPDPSRYQPDIWLMWG
jgi:hypothetical protein